jgi:hypothetical protein
LDRGRHAAEKPYVAPLKRIFMWRRLRRLVRARSARGGGVTITASSPRAFDVSIVDGRGRVVATLGGGESAPPVRLAL